MAPKLRSLSNVDGAGFAEYVWSDQDGNLRSKSKVISVGEGRDSEAEPILERWTTSIDGKQMILSPCHYILDPLRPAPAWIVLCEVRDLKDQSAPFEYRARLRLAEVSPRFWWGFGQTYTVSNDHTLIAERHQAACLDAGLMIHSARTQGTDLSFKFGPRHLSDNFDPDPPTALIIADHILLARHLLERIARERNATVDYAHRSSFPCSLYFSTPEMREAEFDYRAVQDAVQARVTKMYTDSFLVVVPRVSVRDRDYTILELRGLRPNLHPHLLVGRVVDAIHYGGSVKPPTIQVLEGTEHPELEEPPENPEPTAA